MPTTYSDRAAADAILKDFFLGPIRDQLNSETVLSYRVQKNQEVVEGRYVVMPLHTGRNVGVMSRRESGVLTSGANLPSAGRQAWTDMRFLTRYNYGRIKMTGPVMASARTQRGAFARVIDEEVRGLVRDMKNDLNRQYFGDGSGRLGVINAVTAGPPGVYGVTEPWDAANQATSLKWFQVGDRVIAEDVNIAGTTTTLVGLIAGSVSTTISAVDLAAKTISVAAAGAGAAVGDAIVRAYDDAIAVGTGAGISNLRGVTSAVANQASDMMGLVGICSGAGTSGTNWTRNPTAAYSAVPAGQVYAGQSNSVFYYADLQGVSAASTTVWRSNNFMNAGVPRPLTTDLMQQAMDACEQLGQATPTVGICSYNVRRAYVNLLTADRRFVNEYELDGGFKAIDFNGIPIVPDKDCPEAALFLLSEPNLMIARMSDFYWLDKDGAILSRVSGLDEWDAILAYYAELATDRRNAHAVIGDIAI